MVNDMRGFALSLIERNPRIAGNPQAQEMLDAIRRNDEQAGRRIAGNLCKTYGVTEEQAVEQARRFFRI